VKDGPTRTCLGCRGVKRKGELIRLIRRSTGEVIADATGSAGGRGAYVCAEATCLDRGLQRSRLLHAFKKPCEVGANLAGEVRGLWQQQR